MPSGKKGYYPAVFFPFQSFLNCNGLIHCEDTNFSDSPCPSLCEYTITHEGPSRSSVIFLPSESQVCSKSRFAAGDRCNATLFTIDPDVFSFHRCWPSPTQSATHWLRIALCARRDVTSGLGLDWTSGQWSEEDYVLQQTRIPHLSKVDSRLSRNSECPETL